MQSLHNNYSPSRYINAPRGKDAALFGKIILRQFGSAGTYYLAEAFFHKSLIKCVYRLNIIFPVFRKRKLLSRKIKVVERDNLGLFSEFL